MTISISVLGIKLRLVHLISSLFSNDLLGML